MLSGRTQGRIRFDLICLFIFYIRIKYTPYFEILKLVEAKKSIPLEVSLQVAYQICITKNNKSNAGDRW